MSRWETARLFSSTYKERQQIDMHTPTHKETQLHTYMQERTGAHAQVDVV